MGKKSWKQEFYPVPAEKVKPGKEAIKHSLAKWKGLRAKNLEKHGCKEPPIKIDDMTCALCLCDNEWKNEWKKVVACEKCPLYQLLDARCDDDDMPWSIYSSSGDPEPMIGALTKCLKDFE